MEERVCILKCKCGGNGLMTANDDDLRRMYFIQCGSCGKRSYRFRHLDDAIKSWNAANKPNKAKPKYHCGCCGAEVTLGFTVCPKCNSEIDWN